MNQYREPTNPQPVPPRRHFSEAEIARFLRQRDDLVKSRNRQAVASLVLAIAMALDGVMTALQRHGRVTLLLVLFLELVAAFCAFVGVLLYVRRPPGGPS